MRWRPINKFGQNHFATQDDWYGEHFIPKGSVVMINWWAIHYDPKRFPEPHLFKPERFINFPLNAGEEAALADPYERSHVGFGGGRRICPGMHVAERSMFINFARVLWGFDIDFKRDENGEKIPVDFSLWGTEPGSNCTPKKFACGTSSPVCVSFNMLTG
jgi:cytochrome P450